MINLTDYIKESLLDDFEDIEKRQHNELVEHPWGYFWKNVGKSGNWEYELKILEQTISTDAEKSDTSIKNIEKGRVFVTFYKTGSSLTRIYIKYSEKNWSPMWKYFKSQTGRTPPSYKKPTIVIRPNIKMNNIPHICFGEGGPAGTVEGYLLSKEQSKKAIDIIDKFVNSEWVTYWKNL